MLDEILYPNVPTTNWQMLSPERIALAGLLARLRPRRALEVGVFHGGSLALIAQFCEHVWALDVDPEVPNRFRVPSNVDLRIGDPTNLLSNMLDELDSADESLDFVLMDADHSADGIRRDIQTFIHRPKPPREPTFILMHDSGNPECRRGISSAGWAACPFVHHVELDFVPGQIAEYAAIRHGRIEVWGGFALAYLSPKVRGGDLVISAASAHTIAAIQRAAKGPGL
jgi:SAM-dependent methyltransferase